MWASEMVKGSAVFTDDLEPLKSELTAVLIRSTQPHAEILSIDFSEALKVPGLCRVNSKIVI
jgi:xanthine dehydrogenase/oxidase